jgi:hypothetical protein
MRPETRERLVQMILHPEPGSKIAEAIEFGVDLSLTLAQLERTPGERLRTGDSLRRTARMLREAGRRGRK